MPIQMMPTVPSPGARIGGALGTGLGTGLQSLAQAKLDQMRNLEQARRIAPIFESLGLPPQTAMAYAQAPQQVQAEALKQRRADESLQPILSEIRDLFGIDRKQITPEEERSIVQQEMPERVGKPDSKDLVRKIVSGEEAVEKLREGFPLPFKGIQIPERERVEPIREEIPRGFDKPFSPEEAVQISSAIASKDIKSVGKAVRDIFKERKKEEAAEKKALTEEEQRRKKEDVEMYKVSAPQREKIRDNAKRARDELHDLDRMSELQEEGKLDTPGYVEFLKRSGLDIPALMNVGSEEFNKLRQSFLRNMKTYFGSRVSNQEMEQFLKGIPDLSQSPEGRKRVIAGMKRISRGAIEYNDAYMDLLKENNWKLPLYWEEQLQDKVSKRMDKIAELFRADIAKPVPKGQSKLTAALQATVGSLVGAPGKLLSKVGGIGGATETAALL
jgi:hypothetical protein